MENLNFFEDNNPEDFSKEEVDAYIEQLEAKMSLESRAEIIEKLYQEGFVYLGECNGYEFDLEKYEKYGLDPQKIKEIKNVVEKSFLKIIGLGENKFLIFIKVLNKGEKIED